MSQFTGLLSATGLGSMSVFTPSVVDEITATTEGSSGNYSMQVRTSTGYARVDWWDGTSVTYGSGNPGSYMDITKSISSPYDNSSSKTYVLYSCTSGGVRSGNMTHYSSSQSKTHSYFDVSGCASLETITLRIYTGTSLNISNKPLLYDLNLINHQNLSSLTLSGLPSLVSLNVNQTALANTTGWSSLPSVQYLFLGGAPFTSLDLSGFSNLVTFSYYGGNPNLSSITLNNFVNLTTVEIGDTTSTLSINLDNNDSLLSCNCSTFNNAAITDISVNNCTALTDVVLGNNASMTSVRAIGVGANMTYTFGSYYYSLGDGIDVSNCNLDATALDQLYTDLDTTTEGYLLVYGNPGVGSDDPSIATAKGWTVYG